ncbi:MULTISPECIES: MFS transporter [unclassified Luteococcus]|uniref:MFS transporter n=1 Tax=unclassified Luteococcus TaxID=2639923 RepID=UPI00313AF9AC
MSTQIAAPAASEYRGTEKLLWGSVLGLLTFWLFAGSLGAVARRVLSDVNGPYTDAATKTWADPVLTVNQMNLAVAITALFSGLFIVLMGSIADRMGRVRMALVGNVLGVVGSVLVLLSSGSLALPTMLLGRAVQGLSGACIMPATLALVKAYWDGPARQRAVSMWSIGTFGGSSMAALFGGFLASNLGWRYIFVASIVASVLSFAMIWGTPESRAEQVSHKAFDLVGLLLFMVTVLCFMVVVVFGKQLGWTSPTALGLGAVFLLGLVAFVVWERGREHPFMDFALFRNITFTGAVVSNFAINMTIGMLMVSQQMLQLARPERFDAWHAGLLTIGFAVAVISCIRIGEKLLQRFGPRKPMMWGAMILGVTSLLLMQTQVLVGTYVVLAVIAYVLFGLGLAFYATPSTDAALSNLPPAQAGAGAGIYKMASSLGSAIGAAASLAIFTGVMGSGFTTGWVFEMQGIQSNARVRTAGMVTMGFNLLLTLLALASVALTVPKGRKEA